VSAVAALPVAYFGGSAVYAQNFMRSPSINIGSRIPGIKPTVAPRFDPNIGGRVVTGIGRMPPGLRTYPACSYAYRGSDGECVDRPVRLSNGGGSSNGSGKNERNGPRRNVTVQTVQDVRTIAGQIVAEINGSLTNAQAEALARRHGLARLESQNFPLVGATIGLFRITDRRSVEAVRRELAADAGVRSVQPNFRYVLQDQQPALTEGDPAQYAVAKLRLPQAHRLAHGANVTVAVIDSAIDVKHPELANAITDSFDALGSKGLAPGGAQSTSFVVLKALDYAAAHGAQIMNMSFAGSKDPLIERAIAAVAARGIVMIAAAGNAGPKSPPLYPAASANVIAVSATDAHDKLFAASNRGGHIALSAPGVDIFLPVPDEKYQMMSGTSFSAAYVSGLAALMLQRNPSLKPSEVRAVLMQTARDLGAPGRDDLFGSGEADAYAAVSAIGAPPAGLPDTPAAENTSDRQDLAATRPLNQPPAATASDTSAAGDASALAKQ
jgi:subtilisin family serine protease